MRIGLAFDLQSDPSDERQAEFDPPPLLDAIEAALASLGHSVLRLGNAEALLEAPAAARSADLVFNLAEGIGARSREAWVPALLELWGIPFVGSGSRTQLLALDKVTTKRLAVSSGVATPAWRVLASPEETPLAEALRFPVIVKPRYEGSGIGIDPHAVVHSLEGLRRRVEWLVSRFHQPALVEEFVPFGELTVFLIGNNPAANLPVIQRPLDAASRLAWHVSRAADGAPWLCPVDMTPALEAAAADAAQRVFEALGCRDMARADFRVDEQGGLYFLEINPLPSFDPEGTIGLAAECMGTTYAALIGRIVDAAAERIERCKIP